MLQNKTRHKLFLLFISSFLTLFMTSSLNGQKLDSLLEQLQKQKEDTNKVILIQKITREFVNDDIDKQLPYLKEMLNLSVKLNYKRGEANSYLLYCDYYRRTRSWEDALPYLNKADSIYTNTNDQYGKAYINNFMGVYYTETGQYEKALARHHLAQDYYQQTNDKYSQGATLGAIAKLFYYMERYDESEKYYQKYYAIFNELGNKKECAIALLNIGSIYTFKKEYDKAEYYFDKCMQLEKGLNQIGIIAKIQLNKGLIYAERNEFGKAIKILDECYRNYASIHDTLMMGLARMNTAHVYNNAQEYDKAITLLDDGLVLAHTGGADSSVIGNFYYEYYLVYKNQGDAPKALEFHEKYVENKSNVFSKETANKISEMREKFETEKKEQENTTLKKESEIKDLKIRQKNFILYGVLGILFFAGIILYQIFRVSKINNTQKNMQLEQRLLRSQMNPHFMFNALIAIQGFMIRNDPKIAGKFLSSFAKLMRSILENSREEYIVLSKEISWLENYIELQKLRFDNRFEYNIQVSPEINADDILIPPMLTQPFIENALEHGFNHLDKTGMLKVDFIIENNLLKITIADDGKGYDPSQKSDINTQHSSMAIKITKERLTLLNRGMNQKIQFNIWSVPGNGTTVTFSIPLKKRQ